MRIKAACNYETRAARRVAVVLYAIPAVPLMVILGAIVGIAQEMPPLFSAIKWAWNK